MSVDKYPSIFSRQMATIVYIVAPLKFDALNNKYLTEKRSFEGKYGDISKRQLSDR